MRFSSSVSPSASNLDLCLRRADFIELHVGFWRQQLDALNKRKPLKGDLDFLASLVAYLLVFLPLRGWTLRDRPAGESIDSLKDFVLRGLGILR